MGYKVLRVGTLFMEPNEKNHDKSHVLANSENPYYFHKATHPLLVLFVSLGFNSGTWCRQS